ncbi:MAG: hypothetical protein EOM18_07790, partial [Clostridia bacterium]|nr:hypothetical protein [Clostridia bacterium]
FDGIKELNISLDAGVVQIEQYDGKDVKVYLKKDDNKTKVNSEGRELVIDYDSSISIFRAHGKSVKVMIPENQVFNEVDIEVGAGEGIIDNIKTTEFDAEVGAGTLRVTGSVQAERSNWDVAAGSLEIANLASKDTKMECAVGEIQATLDGNEEDYSMKGDIGVGALYFGGSAWEGLGQNVEYGNEKAKNTISIECATGEVNIDFEEN